MKDFTAESFFGLDVGSSAVRLVELTKGGSLPTLRTYGSIPLKKAFRDSDAAHDKDELSQAIRQLVSQANPKTTNVVSNIPSKDAFTSVVRMPKMSEKELEKSIDLQADKYIPMAAKGSKLDWHIIGDASETEMEVLIVAATNDVVEKYADIIQGAGLELQALETDTIAMTRSLAASYEHPVVILRMDLNDSEVIVASRGVPLLARTIAVGRKTLLRSIIQNLNVEEDQAEEFLNKFGVIKNKLEGQILRAVQSPLDDLTSEINNSIKYMATHYEGVKTEKIIVSGAAGAIPDLPLYIANASNTAVELANSWGYVSYPAQQHDKLQSVSLDFTVAIGLAQRSMI